MKDLEITRLCAEAMGWKTKYVVPHGIYARHDVEPKPDWFEYTPLHDDAQAMALVKKLRLVIDWFVDGKCVVKDSETTNYDVESNDLNRAICECVAKMQAAKSR